MWSAAKVEKVYQQLLVTNGRDHVDRVPLRMYRQEVVQHMASFLELASEQDRMDSIMKIHTINAIAHPCKAGQYVASDEIYSQCELCDAYGDAEEPEVEQPDDDSCSACNEYQRNGVAPTCEAHSELVMVPFSEEPR